jgi:suppressor of G2 allele of SKP1
MNWPQSICFVRDPNAVGNRAINGVFKKLYANATDEQKKAMMKSYVESNGTALSTDWANLSQKKMDTRPPDSVCPSLIFFMNVFLDVFFC